MTTRVLIVDDHPLFRDALAALVTSLPDLEVAGVAADGPDAVEIAAGGGVDVVLMDLNLPSMSGVEATRRIHALHDPPSVLVLTWARRPRRPHRQGARGALSARGGLSNKQIALALSLSLKTVQNYVSRILDKLQVSDRTQAALKARKSF